MNELTDMHSVYGVAYQSERTLQELIYIICVSVHNGY